MHFDREASLKIRNAMNPIGTDNIEKPNQVSGFDFKFLGSSLFSYIPWAINSRDESQSMVAINKDLKINNNDVGTTIITEKPRKAFHFDFKLLTLSLLSLVPWGINARDNKRTLTTVNKGLQSRARSRGVDEKGGGSAESLRFRPYVPKVPWHSGTRSFLCQLFPRYGYYCGPNWSSGKDGGSLLWDKRPIDWLDYCCYCHDIGYDTCDQAKLLKADLEFLECLEKQRLSAKGDTHMARVYKTMCITGLRNFLIPYRTQLANLQLRQPMLNFGWLTNVKWRGWKWQET